MVDQETQAQRTPLYQYTSASGLKGIVDNKSLWLTHILYQNDTRELYDGLDLIKRVLNDEYSGLGNDFNSDPARVNIYTASFTEERDLLSQWRGYCPKGGYSYELNPELFTPLAMWPNDLVLRKCIYTEAEKVELIKKTIVGIEPQDYEDYKRRIVAGMNMPHSKEKKRISENIYNNVGVMKDVAFSEEKEWRLMTNHISRQPSIGFIQGSRDYKIRISNEKLIPYIEAKFDRGIPEEQGGQIPSIFKEIIVGPNADPILAKASCELLIKDPSCIVRNSSIPYKNW